jgi:hypothetical protein
MTDLNVDQLLSLPYWSWVKYSPWKIHDDYCDSQGRCWFRKETNQLWFLARPDDDVYNVIACLPHYALPLPSKKVE